MREVGVVRREVTQPRRALQCRPLHLEPGLFPLVVGRRFQYGPRTALLLAALRKGPCYLSLQALVQQRLFPRLPLPGFRLVLQCLPLLPKSCATEAAVAYALPEAPLLPIHRPCHQPLHPRLLYLLLEKAARSTA